MKDDNKSTYIIAEEKVREIRVDDGTIEGEIVSHEFSRVLPLLLLFGSRISSCVSSCVFWGVISRSADSWSSSYCDTSFPVSSIVRCRACIVRCSSCGVRPRDIDLPLDLTRVSLHFDVRRPYNDTFAEISIRIKLACRINKISDSHARMPRF